MAYLRKLGNSPYWIACFRNKDGALTNRSTRLPNTQDNRQKAIRIAEAYEGAYRAHNAVGYLRDNFNRLAREIDPDANIPTVQEYFTRWIEGRTGSLADRTLESYVKRMRDFEEYYGGSKTMDTVKRSHAIGFRGMIAQRSSHATANHGMKILSSVFSYAMKEGVISGNPFAFRKNEKLKGDSVEKTTFSTEQLESLLSVADEEWQSLIFLAYYTGQRLGDLVAMTWGQIDMTKRTIYFKTEKTDRAFHREMAETLYAFLSTSQRGLPTTPVHPAMNALRIKCGIGSVSKEFTRLMVKAGLRKSMPNNKQRDKEGDVSREVNPLSFHSIRHTASTDLRDKAGASDSLARNIIGHDSELVDSGYVHHDANLERAAVNKLPVLKIRHQRTA